ncbi:MAG: UDP-N-acetylmuramate dehydrogenase [Patescibacteria group bacterium]
MILENVLLAPFTTFKVGGSARYFAEVKTIDELKEAVLFSQKRKLPFFVLGGGSNILISDSGFPGLVIKISSRGITHTEKGDHIFVTVLAGEDWDNFVEYAVVRGWHGVENLSGVPGSVGAAPVQNIGCYGSEVKDTIESVLVFDIKEERIKIFPNKECKFSYRSSLFKKPEGKRYVIFSVTFRLSSTPYFQTGETYKDNRFNIGELIKKQNVSPTPKDIRFVILNVREEKGMVIMAGRESYNSAGSFFAAPIVSSRVFENVAEIAGHIDKEKEKFLRPWSWEIENNRIKIAPAFLLEFTQFNKGYYRGKVGISPKHSLSIINRGGSGAGEIYNLARDMRDAVEKVFGVKLEAEVEYVGQFV